ncbi:heavy metal translocating P-type ATPase [Pseudactinotalea sp. HY160]|uniref:heavy metal translocating P-type ATPase n=1 Tax=Pseudactinotalea sp. HY160 TaxID=2654490 RepID=UPI00128DCC7B|nr:cation-translocating P-type ATPase [Pseudactinotalea sp. HY160]MPV49114.1 heavy metal translocating P-type ATPase [Pseudactinotalea sp. HY160]
MRMPRALTSALDGLLGPLGRARVTLAAAVLLAAAAGAHLAGAPGLRDGMLVAAALVALGPIGLRAARALRVRALGIDLLVTVAVIGALVIGEYVEAAVVSFLFLFGAWIEARTLARTRSSLEGLVALAPTTAVVIRDGARAEVPAGQVRSGETVILTPGTRIAVDGEVLTGSASVAEATITGEPVPVIRTAGETVYAGTTVELGYLEVRAKEVGGDTTFAHIIDLVAQAQSSATRGQRFLERFARIYTPAIVAGAVLTGIVTGDVALALTFLVIACPGALVISVPVAMVAGLGTLARSGVLITSGAAAEDLAAATVAVVDKTGTLTGGRPVVTGLDPVGAGPLDLLGLAATVETASEHHLARAIVAAAERSGAPDPGRPSDVVTHPGRGLTARVGGRLVSVGHPDLLAEAGARVGGSSEWIAEHEAAGASVVFVAADADYLGAIAIADAVRPDAAAALADLRATGIDRVVMLTGDNALAAGAVAARVGIDEVHARLLPHEKAEFVARLEAAGERVIMIGDGVNDAPALATARVGIAMGTTGADVSIDSADVVLLGDRLGSVAHARRTTRAMVRIMKQNTALALATVAVLVALVLLHVVGLAGGMLVHEISVLAVILNATRLVRRRDRHTRIGPNAGRGGVAPGPRQEPAFGAPQGSLGEGPAPAPTVTPTPMPDGGSGDDHVAYTRRD